MSCTSSAKIVLDTRDNTIKYHGHLQGDVYRHKQHPYKILYTVPCGQCLDCRLAKKSEWAARMVLEAQMWPHNSFISLTYNDEHVPIELTHRDWQLFIKRFRKHIEPLQVRYFMSGEYGDKKYTFRPHFHAILFNYDFSDKQYLHTNEKGNEVYTSRLLEQMWNMGHVQVGTVTFDSAAYCASYVTKRVTGERDLIYYDGRKPEYARMSKGIGYPWLEKFVDDVLGGQLHLSDRVLPVPRYFWKKIKEKFPDLSDRLQKLRVKNSDIKNNRMLDKGLSPLHLASNKAEITRLNHKLIGDVL